jgi:hypothetical protein
MDVLMSITTFSRRKVMRHTLTIFLFFFTLQHCSAQDSPSRKNCIATGFGLGNLNYISPDGHRTETLYGPIYLKYTRAFNLKTELGVSLSASDFHESIITYANYTYDIKGFSINIRANHFFIGTNHVLQPYIGIGLGFQEYFIKGDSIYEQFGSADYAKEFRREQLHIAYDCTGGIRVMLIKMVGVYSEIGFAQTWFQFGIVTKF